MKLRHFLILSFCCVYIGIQAFFIVRGHFREDKRFAFWMFAESSRYSAKLYRRVNGQYIYTPKAVWRVKGPDGKQVVYRWHDFVRDFRLGNLEKLKRAKTGFAVTVKYLDHGLDYVMDHIAYDKETEQLMLKVKYSKAKGPWQHLTLYSYERTPPSSSAL